MILSQPCSRVGERARLGRNQPAPSLAGWGELEVANWPSHFGVPRGGCAPLQPQVLAKSTEQQGTVSENREFSAARHWPGALRADSLSLSGSPDNERRC